MTRIELILRVALWVVVLLAAAVGIANMADMIVRDLPGDYVEGVVLAGQQDILEGRSLYDRDRWLQPPYSINLYGPVYYSLGASVASVMGGGASLIPGRLLTVLSLLLALAASWQLQRRLLGFDRVTALLGVLLPVGLLPVVVFGAQYRVDTFAIACGLWGLVVGASGGRRVYLAPLFFVVAVYTKPTAIAAALALFVWLLFRRRWRDVVIISVGCLMLGGVTLVVLQMLTDGAFVRSVFGFNALPFAVGGLIRAAQYGFSGGLVALGAGVAVSMLTDRSPAARLTAGYMLVALLFALATVGRVGANFNYFIEPGLMVGPVLAFAWHRALRADDRRVMGTAAAIGLAMLASSLLWTLPRVVHEWRGRDLRQQTEAAVAAQVGEDETILTMEIVTALRIGARPYLNDPAIFASLANVGLWDESRLLSDLQNGTVRWVLADEDLEASRGAHSNWSNAVRETVAAHFEFVQTAGDRLRLYRYGSLSPLRDER